MQDTHATHVCCKKEEIQFSLKMYSYLFQSTKILYYIYKKRRFVPLNEGDCNLKFNVYLL